MKTPEQWLEDIKAVLINDLPSDELLPIIQAIQKDAVETTERLGRSKTAQAVVDVLKQEREDP